jgi:hypothetical protein
MGPDDHDSGAGALPARTILIGDIHGCVDELQDLLKACAVDWKTDRVISVGDLVAKGPDSHGVLQLVRETGIAAVLGNHDAKLLTMGPQAQTDAARADAGDDADHHAAVARTLDAADWELLGGLPLYLDIPALNVLVVHGGIRPGVPIEDQPRGVLMNLRSITPAGAPSNRVDGGVPWASLWTGPRHVVFGHDAIRGLQQYPHATGLDTGCVYGRQLTALILPENRLVSVLARRVYCGT